MHQSYLSLSQLIDKLHTAECSIENLAQQLQALQMSGGGAPSTMRRDQDDMLLGIQEKHRQETVSLSEKLDKANHLVEEKVTGGLGECARHCLSL